jgi:hypothetical protein
MRNLTLTIHFCDISQSFVSATKYENTSNAVGILHRSVKCECTFSFLTRNVIGR